jgi:hypothetical protein
MNKPSGPGMIEQAADKLQGKGGDTLPSPLEQDDTDTGRMEASGRRTFQSVLAERAPFLVDELAKTMLPALAGGPFTRAVEDYKKGVSPRILLLILTDIMKNAFQAHVQPEDMQKQSSVYIETWMRQYFEKTGAAKVEVTFTGLAAVKSKEVIDPWLKNNAVAVVLEVARTVAGQSALKPVQDAYHSQSAAIKSIALAAVTAKINEQSGGVARDSFEQIDTIALAKDGLVESVTKQRDKMVEYAYSVALPSMVMETARPFMLKGVEDATNKAIQGSSQLIKEETENEIRSAAKVHGGEAVVAELARDPDQVPRLFHEVVSGFAADQLNPQFITWLEANKNVLASRVESLIAPLATELAEPEIKAMIVRTLEDVQRALTSFYPIDEMRADYRNLVKGMLITEGTKEVAELKRIRSLSFFERLGYLFPVGGIFKNPIFYTVALILLLVGSAVKFDVIPAGWFGL